MGDKSRFDGTLRERNPVYGWLMIYGKMSRGDIICHIRSWGFNQEGTDLFEQAKNSGLIRLTRYCEECIKKDSNYAKHIEIHEWEIANTSQEDEIASNQ